MPSFFLIFPICSSSVSLSFRLIFWFFLSSLSLFSFFLPQPLLFFFLCFFSFFRISAGRDRWRGGEAAGRWVHGLGESFCSLKSAETSLCSAVVRERLQARALVLHGGDEHGMRMPDWAWVMMEDSHGWDRLESVVGALGDGHGGSILASWIGFKAAEMD